MIEKHGNGRIGYLDSVKGVAILLVCLGHLIQNNVSDFSGTILHSFIFAVQMPLFMIVSGFFSCRSSISSRRDLCKEILGKAVVYLLPYLSRIFIFEVLVGEPINQLPERIAYIFPYQIDEGLWYLYVIFFLYVALRLSVYVQSKFSLRGKTAKIFVTTILFGVFLMPWLAISAAFGFSFMGAKLILYYSVFYYLGYLWHMNSEKIEQITDSTKTNICAVCMLVGMYLIAHYPVFTTGDGIVTILVRFISGACFSIVLISLISKYEVNMEKMGLCRIGQYSLEIYYIHGVATSILATGIKPALCSVDGLIMLIASSIVTALVTFAAIVLIKQYDILNFLLFAKKKK